MTYRVVPKSSIDLTVPSGGDNRKWVDSNERTCALLINMCILMSIHAERALSIVITFAVIVRFQNGFHPYYQGKSVHLLTDIVKVGEIFIVPG